MDLFEYMSSQQKEVEAPRASRFHQNKLSAVAETGHINGEGKLQ